MEEANAECYIERVISIVHIYVIMTLQYLSIATPLFLSFNFLNSVKRMGVANTECYYKDINYYLLKEIVTFIIILNPP